MRDGPEKHACQAFFSFSFPPSFAYGLGDLTTDEGDLTFQ